MNAHQIIRLALEQAAGIFDMYLQDLSDADLLQRPVPGANHILWQIGHLIAGEHMIVAAIAPESMPMLPAGFSEKYSTATAGLDSPADFHNRAELLELRARVRQGTLAALATFSEADFDKPAPESIASFLKTYGDAFMMTATHENMHTGQWAVTRRKLGLPPLF